MCVRVCEWVHIQFDRLRLRLRNVHSLWKYFLRNRIILFFYRYHWNFFSFESAFLCFVLLLLFLAFLPSLALLRFLHRFSICVCFFSLLISVDSHRAHALSHRHRLQSKRTIGIHIICVWTNASHTLNFVYTSALNVCTCLPGWLAIWLVFDFWFVAIFSI